MAPFPPGAQFGERLCVHVVLRGDEPVQILHVLEMVAILLDATPDKADALRDVEEDSA